MFTGLFPASSEAASPAALSPAELWACGCPPRGRGRTSSTEACQQSLQTSGPISLLHGGAPEVTPLGEDRQMGLDSDELQGSPAELPRGPGTVGSTLAPDFAPGQIPG